MLMTVGVVNTTLPQIHMIPVFPCIARRPTSKLNLENNDTKHDSLFSFFFFDSNFHLQNTSEDQLMHTALGHNLVP